jgi:hypothetical protein
MTGDQLQLLFVACLALFAVLLGFWQLQSSRKLRAELEMLKARLQEQPSAKAAPVSFSTSLDTIERQQLQAAQPRPPAKSVDKYSYVAALAEQGLDAKGIASALQLPRAEVEQLLRLARLRQPAAPK